MAKRKRHRCAVCNELINFEDLKFCERCDVPLHDWCAESPCYYLGYCSDGYYCPQCSKEIEEEIKDSDEYEYFDNDRCPNCGTFYVREENLVWCPNCGYEPF